MTTSLWIAFLIGAFILGSTGGLVLACVLHSSADADETADRIYAGELRK